MRPRFSQQPRRIVSSSDLVFSGNAAARLARPIRFSGSNGPIVRIIRPAKSDILSGSVSRTPLRAAIASVQQRMASVFKGAPHATDHSPHQDTPGFTWRMDFAEEPVLTFQPMR